MSADPYGWPTVRRYSRSLGEAFPCERFPVVEHYRSPRLERAAGVALAVLIGIALALLLARHLGA